MTSKKPRRGPPEAARFSGRSLRNHRLANLHVIEITWAGRISTSRANGARGRSVSSLGNRDELRFDLAQPLGTLEKRVGAVVEVSAVAENRRIAESATITSASIAAARSELVINSGRSPIQSARIPPGRWPDAYAIQRIVNRNAFRRTTRGPAFVSCSRSIQQ